MSSNRETEVNITAGKLIWTDLSLLGQEPTFKFVDLVLTSSHNRFKQMSRLTECFHLHLVYVILFPIHEPGREAQSVGHLTRKSEVLGSIPGLATYFRFSFR